MATPIPEITEEIEDYSVTPVLNSATFPEDIDTYNSEQPSRITSKNTVNQQINAVRDAMNIVSVEVEDNALISQAAANYQGDWSATPTSPVVYPYPLGVSVSNSGSRWASKVNSNSEEPVAESANWAKLPETGEAPYFYTPVKTSAYTAINRNVVPCDTSGGVFINTLPATPNENDIVVFQDVATSFSANNLEIARNGQTIMGLTESIFLDIDNARVEFLFKDSDWKVST